MKISSFIDKSQLGTYQIVDRVIGIEDQCFAFKKRENESFVNNLISPWLKSTKGGAL